MDQEFPGTDQVVAQDEYLTYQLRKYMGANLLLFDSYEEDGVEQRDFTAFIVLNSGVCG